MDNNRYWFVSQQGWKAVLQEVNSPNPFRYQTFSISPRKAEQLKPIRYFDANNYQSIIEYCLANPNSCYGLSEIFDLLANQYGAGHYLKSLPQQRKALIDGLQNQHIVLLREEVTYDGSQPIQPALVTEETKHLSTEEFIVSIWITQLTG